MPTVAIVRELAQGVADLLLAQVFSEPCLASRAWLAVNEIEDTEHYLVQVVPDLRAIARASRAAIQHDCTIHVTVQKRHGDSPQSQIAPVARCDVVADFAQEVEDFLLTVATGTIVTANLKAVPVGATTTMDSERLETLGIVAVDIAMLYRLFR